MWGPSSSGGLSLRGARDACLPALSPGRMLWLASLCLALKGHGLLPTPGLLSLAYCSPAKVGEGQGLQAEELWRPTGCGLGGPKVCISKSLGHWPESLPTVGKGVGSLSTLLTSKGGSLHVSPHPSSVLRGPGP